MGPRPVHPGSELRTKRLLLRRWRAADREVFAAMNADAEVMAYYPAPLSRSESDALVDRIEARFDEVGYGLWALEVTATGRFIGYTGLSPATFDADFTPAIEVGWRLCRPAWGHGYASEAAAAALDYAFRVAGLAEVVSFTTEANERSRAVMRRIGMTRDPADDFDHPNLPPGHPLLRHVLYRIGAPARDQAD